ncbi:hypothetical protein AGOR_G00129660 [Albula goreensis]|uniref:CCDC92/74 N-terminal domain-containing protein n=1 Tax=Albula goreensis TaxID=1534307 RepID=A0A8T3DET7_9TELE|nr:hypothetical protein AGOR_G00129660 [Albula goreensis]
METSWLAAQVERVERSVAFLRQDQLALLHGLHLEILRLQKRCTELTCELEVKPLGRTQAEVEAEEEYLEERCREVEMRLEEEQWTVEELHKELSQKGALVRALRNSLRDEERRFLQELQRRSHRSTELHTQLRIQTETAAYLSFQLHAARRHLRQMHLQRPLQTPPPAQLLSPPAALPLQRRAQLRGERARECVPRERVTAPAEPIPMPDPALFLPPGKRRSCPPFTPTQSQEDTEEGQEDQGEGEEEAENTEEDSCCSSPVDTVTPTTCHQPETQDYNCGSST